MGWGLGVLGSGFGGVGFRVEGSVLNLAGGSGLIGLQGVLCSLLWLCAKTIRVVLQVYSPCRNLPRTRNS